MKEWKFASKVMLTKKDLLALSDLAGEDSIQDYLEKLIRKHIAAEQVVVADVTCSRDSRGWIYSAWMKMQSKRQRR